jgi:hypothetical protein
MRSDVFLQNFHPSRPGQHQTLNKMDRRIRSGDDTVHDDRTARAALTGLTMRKCGGAFCVDPEQPRGARAELFINSKPQRGLLCRG